MSPKAAACCTPHGATRSQHPGRLPIYPAREIWTRVLGPDYQGSGTAALPAPRGVSGLTPGPSSRDSRELGHVSRMLRSLHLYRTKCAGLDSIIIACVAAAGERSSVGVSLLITCTP
jgi:hypothetical protein